MCRLSDPFGEAAAEERNVDARARTLAAMVGLRIGHHPNNLAMFFQSFESGRLRPVARGWIAASGQEAWPARLSLVHDCGRRGGPVIAHRKIAPRPYRDAQGVEESPVKPRRTRRPLRTPSVRSTCTSLRPVSARDGSEIGDHAAALTPRNPETASSPSRNTAATRAFASAHPRGPRGGRRYRP